MHNKVLTKKEAWPQISEGVTDGMEIVAATYGLRGGNVSLVDGFTINGWDDGKKALESYSPLDPIRRQGLLYVRDAAFATHRTCGDGTSTTALLAGSMILRYDPKEDTIGKIQEDLDQALNEIDDFSMHMECGTLSSCIKVATTSMHGDKPLGEIVGTLIHEIGKDGVIVMEPSKDHRWGTKKAAGLSWTGSVLGEAFYNDKGRMNRENPFLVFVDSGLEAIKDKFWESVFLAWKNACIQNEAQLPLIVVCRGASGAFLSNMRENAKNGLPLGVVTCDNIEILENLAILTGGKLFSDIRGSLKHMGCLPEDFGRCRVVQGTSKSVSIVPLESIGDRTITDLIAERTALIQAEYNALGTDASEDDDVKRRTLMAVLNSSFGTIYVPMVSDSQFQEAKEIIEDGVRATINSFGGVVPGGGIVLARISNSMQTQVMMNSLIKPFRVLMKSSGVEDTPSVGNSPSSVDLRYFDFESQTFRDAYEDGVLDTAKTLKQALINSVSVAISVIKTKLYLCPDE